MLAYFLSDLLRGALSSWTAGADASNTMRVPVRVARGAQPAAEKADFKFVSKFSSMARRIRRSRTIPNSTVCRRAFRSNG
jgi:hypothetical protein